MKREFLTTKDGSVTIHLPDWNEQYHSKHGAINEAKHVCVESGFRYLISSEENQMDRIAIMEIGFGTGLNAFLTYLNAEKYRVETRYTGVDAFPVIASEITQLNYPELLSTTSEVFGKLHQTPWESPEVISRFFTLTKRKQLFSKIKDKEEYHLIYFDAFGARVQPELWTESIFKAMYEALKIDGILVT